jgi:hypothetical protein
MATTITVVEENVVIQVATSGLQGGQGPTGATGATGATGPTGPSGTVAVTAPITNSGTSTAANIGIDQTGLTIVKSQVTGTAVTQADSRTVTGNMIGLNTIANANIWTGAAIDPAKINGTAVVTADSRLSDTRVPTDNSVTNAKIVSTGLDMSVINSGAITNWAPSTAYTKGDIVNYLGVAYRRIATSTSGTTFDPSNWNQVTPAISSLQSPPVNTWIGNGTRASLTGDTTNTNGGLIVVPFAINTQRTLDAVAVLTGSANTAPTAGAVGRIGIWKSDLSGVPSTLVKDCGTIALTGTGTTGAPLQISSLNTVLPAGMYWIGCVIQNAGAVLPTMVVNATSTVQTPFTYTFQSTSSTALATDFSGNNTYFATGVTSDFGATTPPSFAYNSPNRSPIKVIYRFTA